MLREQLDTPDPFLVVSGYRSPATNMRLYLHGEGVAKHSYHIKGMAVDLRSEGRSLEQVREAALSLQCGGVGYYPQIGFRSRRLRTDPALVKRGLSRAPLGARSREGCAAFRKPDVELSAAPQGCICRKQLC